MQNGCHPNQQNITELEENFENFEENIKEQALFVWKWSEWSECLTDVVYQNSRKRVGQNCYGTHCMGEETQYEPCPQSNNYNTLEYLIAVT